MHYLNVFYVLCVHLCVHAYVRLISCVFLGHSPPSLLFMIGSLMKLELAPSATVAGRLASLKDAPQAGLPSTGITGVSCCAPVLYVGAGDGPQNMYKGNFKVWASP